MKRDRNYRSSIGKKKHFEPLEDRRVMSAGTLGVGGVDERSPSPVQGHAA